MNKKSLQDVGKRTVEGLFFFSFLICMQIKCMDGSICDGWATLPKDLVASILHYGDFCSKYNLRRTCKNYYAIIKPHRLSAQNIDIDTYTQAMICYARDDNKDMFVWLKKNTIRKNREETNYIDRYISVPNVKDKESSQLATYKNSDYAVKALYNMCGYSDKLSPFIQLLIHQGIDINHQWGGGDTLLHFMAFGRNGTVEQRCSMIELLLKQPDININAQNAIGETPLHYTIYDVEKDGWRGVLSDEQRVKIQEQLRQMKQLLDDPRIVINMQDNEGNTVLHRAIIYDNDQQLEYLLQRPHIDINIQNNDGNAPVHFYAFYKNSDNIKNFFVNTAVKNKKGNTPLHLAKRSEQYNYLLNVQDIDVNVQNKKGEAPLHYSIKHPYVIITGRGCLEVAITVTSWDQSKALLHDQRTNITIATEKGKTPLHYAAKYSHKIVKLLVQKLDEDALKSIDNDGRTALHVAARYGNNKSVVLLLEKLPQESINLEDSNGEKPLDHAYKKYEKKRPSMYDYYRNFAYRDKTKTIELFLKSDKVDTSFFCLYKKILQRGLLAGLVGGLAVIFIYFLYGDTRV